MTASLTVSVDYSGIGSRRAQDRVRACLGSLGLDGRELTGFWEKLLPVGADVVVR